MKTPLLLHVPKTHPSSKEKLKAFKEQHSIETHSAGIKYSTEEFAPWLAVWLPPCRKLGYGVTEEMGAVELFAHVGRLIEDAGYCAYGKTEREAILELCKQNNISCLL